MDNRNKVARAMYLATQPGLADTEFAAWETPWVQEPEFGADNSLADVYLKAADAALSAMQGDGWRQEVHTVLLNAAHELRATAPFIGGSGQVDMLAVADRCLALTLPELPAQPSDEWRGIEPVAWRYHYSGAEDDPRFQTYEGMSCEEENEGMIETPLYALPAPPSALGDEGEGA